MKKYLMMGVAALALASCSNHDFDFDQEAAIEFNKAQIVEKYNQAFIKTFGQPAANQTWGFGSTTKGLTRAIEVAHKFATAPSDAEFATEIPSNAELITGYKDGNNFYIDESINGNGQKIQPNVPWNASVKDVVLYVKGDVKPSGLYTPANTTIYLLPGSKLTVPSDACSFGQNYTKIYIAEGAELICGATAFEFGYGVSVFNRGTISATDITISNTGLLYNEGTIDIPGKIKVTNSDSELVNDGTLKAANLGTEGSGHVQNNAVAVISNETLVNSNNNTWVNNGNYTTGKFTYQAGGNDVVNNCLLTVTEKFYINLGDTDKNGFRLDGTAGVVTKDFEGAGPFYIQMGGNSVFKVTGTATMHSTKKDYGFYGVGDDYAVLEATKIVKGGEGQGFEITYGGNLVVSTDDHFAQGHDGDETHPFTYIRDNAKVYAPGYTDGKSEIVIPASECNPGFGKTTTQPETPETPETGTKDPWQFVARVFAEDLSASTGSDFDFNDVVFDVYNNTTEAKAKIVLRAAGGTLPLTVNGTEVHYAFMDANPGVALTKTSMINTRKAGSVDAPNCPVIDLEYNITTMAQVKAIEIKVEKTVLEAINGIEEAKTDWIVLNAETGQPAAKFAVTEENVNWCDERENISETYPNFGKWVKGEVEKWWK